jgi:hypothetical protein
VRAAAAVLALAIAGSAHASDLAGELARQARFSALFGGAETSHVAPVARPGGLTITGEKIQLEGGNFTASMAQVSSNWFKMDGVAAKGRMPIDEAFFADAIAAAVNNILDGSTMTVASFKNSRDDAGSIANITVKDMVLVHKNKALEGSMKASIAHPEFKGHSAFDRATRQLTVTLDSVKVAGIPVPMGIAFSAMGSFMNYPFVELKNPRIIIHLNWFLPPPSGNQRTR